MYKLLVLSVILVGAFLVIEAKNHKEEHNNDWHEYKRQHKKNYQSLDHESNRRTHWEKTHEKIRKHNSEHGDGKHGYKMAHHTHSDMSKEEFNKHRKGYKPSMARSDIVIVETRSMNELRQAPASYDARTQGLVTPVRDQGQCGCCWAFAAVAGIEGAVAKKSGKLTPLSEQDLIDCSAHNNGCNGGLPINAFQDVIKANGITSLASYPFVGTDGRSCKKVTKAITIKSYGKVKSGDENALASAIFQYGPVTIGIDASHESLAHYSSGIYSDPNCGNQMDSLDHAVTVVGYGSAGTGKDFWIVKNSWNTGWGENGYVRVARNKGNMCGVATDAVYAIA